MIASVVVPVWNDVDALRMLIADLRREPRLEIVVADGGSDDGSAQLAAAEAAATCPGARGRGRPLQPGAMRAGGDWLWFLHADTRVSAAALSAFTDVIGEPSWGWFDVRLDSPAWPLRVVETAMNVRSALGSITTGDQGIFVHRRLLDAVGGVPEQPLMEDVELCKRLRRLAKPRRLGTPLLTSARRWERDGIAATVAQMWWLRLRYFLHADPDALAASYYR